MANTPPTTPTNWPDLLKFLRAIPRSHGENFMILFGMTRDMAPADSRSGPPLYNATDSLCRGIVLGQGAMMSKPAAALRRHAEGVRDANDEKMRRLPSLQLAALGSVHVAEAAGQPPMTDTIEKILPRLWQNKFPDPLIATQAIWACLGWGHADEAREMIVSCAATHPSFRDSRVNAVQTSMASNGPAGAIDMFLRDFPELLASHQTTWCELLWAARAAHVVAGAGVVTGVSEWVLSKVEG